MTTTTEKNLSIVVANEFNHTFMYNFVTTFEKKKTLLKPLNVWDNDL